VFALAAFIVFLLGLFSVDLGGASPVLLGLALLALHFVVPVAIGRRA
jgi:hypothetical protein